MPARWGTGLLENGKDSTQCQQDNLSNHLVGETGAQTMMGQWHLDQGYLIIPISFLLFKPQSPVRTLKMHLVGIHGPFLSERPYGKRPFLFFIIKSAL